MAIAAATDLDWRQQQDLPSEMGTTEPRRKADLAAAWIGPKQVTRLKRLLLRYTARGAAASAELEESRSEALERTFKNLADTWRKETRFVSGAKRKALHPAYQRIIGMGPTAIPFILRELRERSEDWLWALNAITGEDPAAPNATFEEAVSAWLRWGKERHYA